jgi:uncharacterized repeat protein (TIGR03803 family)
MKPGFMRTLQLLIPVSFLVTIQATAQTLTTLHSFAGSADGWFPVAPVILAGNSLYGTTFYGGSSNEGTLFRVNTDGTGFVTLHHFTGGTDGGEPRARLLLSGDMLFGTTEFGGVGGTVFAIHTDGTGFTNPYTFQTYSTSTKVGGGFPTAGLILSANTLYGTTSQGGSSGNGTVFKLNTDGTGFESLYNFSATSPQTSGNGFSNIDGVAPHGGLVLSSNTLYGTTAFGGNGGNGTIFGINTDGTGFQVLHAFASGNWGQSDFSTSSNVGGGNPKADLVLSGATLYGTAENGGSLGGGTVFKVNTDGTGFTTLQDFSWDKDGRPFGALVLSGDTLYGTTTGTIFGINRDGTHFTTLYRFSGGIDGNTSEAGLTLSGNVLYGVTLGGGASGNGMIFGLALPLQLTITPAGANLTMSWPTNFSGFNLQSAGSIGPAAGWKMVDLPGPPVIQDGQYSVSIPGVISSPQQFYRLSR